MRTNTLKEYKKAIRIKYEIEREREYFDYLNSPSRGKLRDFCWLIFEDNPTEDDLKVFKNLFSIDFDPAKKKKFKEQKDKFRPIETFFKGETDPSNIDAINMAAILVDFEPRPFKKFHEKCRLEETKQIGTIDKPKKAVKNEKEVIDIFKWRKRYKSIGRNLRQVMALF
ncbi:hypothetical protein [Flavobacterium pectinovorum]|uniref:Uncharacterized protein n=1 Tax=Flavobacterium pectinovorum TaxID=29533 RepID=A0A502E8S9_9FLAO|nr:hypothetical protein [Flavobacterium pectinovorum]TPG32926.1 hypothetical protein EAH81_24855 [Flavobacterium pectinovorum]